MDTTEANNKLDIILDLMSKSYLKDKVYDLLTPYNLPGDIKINIPFDIQTNLSGAVRYKYDVSVNKNNVNKTYYVDINTGNNSNPGTEDRPFKSIHRALRYNDADEIIVKTGVYGWSDGYNAYTQTKSYNLIGDGDVYVGAHRDNLSWVQNESYNNVYNTNVSSVIEIIDILDFENPNFLTEQDNIESVNINPGSYYIDSSNNIFIRTLDDRIPDEFILCNMDRAAVNASNVKNIYLENIHFTNTVDIEATTDVDIRFHAKNCDFYFGTNDNSLSIKGADFIIQNCRAKYAERDGFNYHFRREIKPSGIEIDCIGAYNGRDGGNSNNGSTMHDGGSIVRINGEYHHNHGPNVIDVNPGTKSLNIGVHAHSSTATSSLSNVDFRTRDADMWLVNCMSHGSNYSTSVEGNANMYKDNSLLIGEESIA